MPNFILPPITECPFCGETGVTCNEGSTYRWRIAECDYCGAVGPEVRVNVMADMTPAERSQEANVRAVEAWNERKPKKETNDQSTQDGN